MAKTKVSQFDTVASNNTDINSVNVAEGCPPSGINNAIREMASLLKKQEVGTDAMTSPDIDGGTIDGATIGGSSGVTIGVSDGTVSAPSIKFTGDTNTGIYRGGTDILKFVTAGTDAVTITASQQVGIGASSIGGVGTPKTFIKQSTTNYYEGLLVSANANDNVTAVGHTGTEGVIGSTYGTSGSFTPLIFKTSNNDRLNIASNGDISFYEDTGTTPKLFWDASAERLGIGTASPTYPLHVLKDSDTDYNPSTASFNTILTLENTTSGALNNALMSFATESNGEWYIGGVENSANTASDFVFVSRDSGARAERMRIDSSGNVLVSTTVSSGSNAPHNTNSATYEGFVLGESGSLLVGSALEPVGQLNAIGYDGDILRFRKNGSTVGSIGVLTDRIYLAGANEGVAIDDDLNAFIPTEETGGARNNASDLGANGVFWRNLYLGGGIYFGTATDAHKLDDYEEGFVNLGIYPSASGTITVGTNADRCEYTKVGRKVTITGLLGVASVSSPVGQYISIQNLPFTVANLTDYAGTSAGSVMFKDNSDTSSNRVTSKGTYAPEGFTILRAYIDPSTIVAGDDFYISLTYFTT